jgi:hypothetical protein
MDRRLFLQGSAAVAGASAVSHLHPALNASSYDGSLTAEPGWWMTEPIRWVHPNFRQTDAALNPKLFVASVADFNANVLIAAMAGITASYSSNVEYEYVSPYMPTNQDTFGEVLREAHARNIRVAKRCDFSKTRKDVYDAHPDWFFKMADGRPSIYNGLYQICINAASMCWKASASSSGCRSSRKRFSISRAPRASSSDRLRTAWRSDSVGTWSLGGLHPYSQTDLRRTGRGLRLESRRISLNTSRLNILK